MRFLTAAEARVIQSLLAKGNGEEERYHQSGVPRTTFQTIRRRAFVNGWLKQRYIPSPAFLGLTSVGFTLAQPFADRRGEAIRALRSLPGLVLMWVSPDAYFCVNFLRETAKPSGSPPRSPIAVPLEPFRRTWAVVAAVDRGHIPIYFDYEGAWARYAARRPPLSYPLPLEFSPALKESRLRPSHGVHQAAIELVARPFERGPTRKGALFFSTNRLPRAQRMLYKYGCITHRIFPDLVALPPMRENRIERIIFVTGLFLDGSKPDELLVDLLGPGNVSPLLFAHDGRRVLLAGLATTPVSTVRTAGFVTDLLKHYLRDIETVREDVQLIQPIVDHRYGQLLESSSADRLG